MKERIKELRLNGVGYGVIAKELGIKKETVRWHATQMGLNGVRGPIDVKKKRFCVICNNEIKQGYSKYCSDECKKANKKPKKRSKYKQKCKRCNKEFKADYTKKFCSKECRSAKFERVCNCCGKKFITTREEQEYCTQKCFRQTKTKTHKEFVQELIERHEGKVVPLELYKGSDYKLKCLCLDCGNEMIKVARFYKTYGCKHCGGNKSNGETLVAKWLDEHNYDYCRQYTSDDLKMYRNLLYDFAIMKDNQPIMFIEYDGEQHFKPIERFGGEDTFNETIMRDNIKTNYAYDNDIPLIRISYKDKDNVEQILSERLRGL